MNNIVTTDTNTNVVVVTAPGPSGPIGPQGPQGLKGTVEANSGFLATPFLNVSSSMSVTGSAEFLGRVVVTGSLTVSGSNTFINIGPALFTGSVGVSGSLYATTFSGSGEGLTGIPASGITGLNLSRIATTNVSASVSEGGTVFTLSNGGTNIFTVSSTGLGTFTNGLTVNGSTTNINQGLVVANGATLNGGTTIGTSLSVNGTATVNNLTVTSGGVTTLNGTATLNGADILTSATVSTNRITDSNISASVSSTGKPFTVTDNTTELLSVDAEGSISGSGIYISGSDITLYGPNILLSGSATLNGELITTAGDLTLNQIKSGAVTASVSTGADSFTLKNSGVDLFKVSNTGVVTVSQSINIGRAEDGDYTDGLYTDITSDTPVGTMIDRFNEVLKGLSPAPAPDLSNIQSSTTKFASLLAFGSTNSTSSYTNVTGLTGLPAVGFTSNFNPSNNTRLGVFAAPQNISVVLNENVPANGSPFVNYPANAFNVPVDGGETYTLDINDDGNPITVTPLGTNPTSSNGFSLSLAQTGSFPSTGLSFNIFRHRTGTVTIPTSRWRNGWNYVKVTQGSNVTNFIDWVYDPAAASSNFPYTFTGFQTGSVTPTGQKNLSGIKYYTGFSYRVTGTIGNFYKNTYTSDPRSFTGTNLSMGTVSITSPDNADSTLSVDSLHAFTGTRLLGATLSSTLTISNVFGKSGTTGAITTPTILLDNVNTANSNTQENFCLEDRRVPLASYDTQISVTDAIGTFASDNPLGSSDLAVYAGTLRYPTQVRIGGNVGDGIVYAIANQPNYSGVTEDRWFFRAFINGTGAVATFNVSISGTNINFTTFGGTLTTNAVKIWIKIPGKTGWRDALTPAPGSTDGIKTNDNVGCLNGSAPSNITSQATRNIGINMATEGLGASEYFMVRVQASSGWTGTINQINFSGL